MNRLTKIPYGNWLFFTLIVIFSAWGIWLVVGVNANLEDVGRNVVSINRLKHLEMLLLNMDEIIILDQSGTTADTLRQAWLNTQAEFEAERRHLRRPDMVSPIFDSYMNATDSAVATLDRMITEHYQHSLRVPTLLKGIIPVQHSALNGIRNAITEVRIAQRNLSESLAIKWQQLYLLVFFSILMAIAAWGLYATLNRSIEKTRITRANLRVSRRLYEILARNATDMISLHDPDGVMTYVSPASAHLLRQDFEKICGSTLEHYAHPDDRNSVRRVFIAAGARPLTHSISYRLKPDDREQTWVETNLRSIRKPGADGIAEIIAITRDITAQRRISEELLHHRDRLEELVYERTDSLEKINRTLHTEIQERIEAELELKNSREQLRSLSAHLESAREEERSWIAREIHDELGQVLSALKMDLNWLERKLTPLNPEVLNKTKSMSTLISTTIQKVRKISQGLRPSILDNLGLHAAMKWQLDEFRDRSGLQCSLEIHGEEEIEPNHSNALFRVFQETLTNIFRHANASSVCVKLNSEGGMLHLIVIDDGDGITEAEANSQHSFGLLGIRERIAYLDGYVSVSGAPGAGTTVSVRVPARKEIKVNDKRIASG